MTFHAPSGSRSSVTVSRPSVRLAKLVRNTSKAADESVRGPEGNPDSRRIYYSVPLQDAFTLAVSDAPEAAVAAAVQRAIDEALPGRPAEDAAGRLLAS